MSSGFPSIKKTKIICEVGVNAVSTIVNDEFQWLFRKNHDEHDFGIDGYLDVITENGNVTGQSIAVQIKSGESYFKTKTSNGFTFYGEMKHLNYYINQSIPVVIIIHDDKTGKTYYEVFKQERTEATTTSWKINILKANLFNLCAKKKLLELLGPAKDSLGELKEHWAFNKKLLNADVVHYAIGRDDIESKNIKPFVEFFKRLENNDNLCKKIQGRIDISVSGYAFDSRELWEIRDVRKWFKKADPKINWLYYCNLKLPAYGFKTYVACLCEVIRLTPEEIAENPGYHVSIDLKSQKKIFMSNFDKLNSMTDHLGMSIEENKAITYAAFDAVGFPYDKNA